MKLYTRSEIIKMLDFFHVNDADIIQFVDTLEPVVLPTDEEIENYYGKVYVSEDWEGFKRGTKWMRDKILNK